MPEATMQEYYGFNTTIQAEATAMEGFTVRNDFDSMVGNYIRTSSSIVLWPLLRKQPAEADPVRELLRVDHPPSGFFDKHHMTGLIETPTNNPHHDFSDIPQPIVSGGGLILTSAYSQALYNQQNRPYGDILAEKTEQLVSSTCITLEKALFTGDNAANPLSFNGLDAQINPSHIVTADTTAGDKIVHKIRGICRLAMWDEKIVRNITHIFTTGLGCELIENEMDERLQYRNLDTITPGLRVPTIITHAGPIPIVPSPFIIDTDGGAGTDTVRYYIVDMNQLRWKGVYPLGGGSTFNPQIFDVTKWTNNTMEYLVEKRLCLFYGTLKVLNKGDGVWRLDVTVPSGTVGSV
jgi:hypothetical protein